MGAATVIDIREIEQESFEASYGHLSALHLATVALRFFQTRRSRRPLFKSGRRKTQTVSNYSEHVRSARALIRMARARGWRGSVIAAYAPKA